MKPFTKLLDFQKISLCHSILQGKMNQFSGKPKTEKEVIEGFAERSNKVGQENGYYSA